MRGMSRESDAECGERLEVERTRRPGIGCDSCHGSEHLTAEDVAKAKLPTAETCGQCQADRLEQFKKGKHALAWAAMEAMPTIHYQPMAMTEGMKGCGGCHKIG